MCMDLDCNGVLTFDEFQRAYDQYYKPQFAKDEGFSDEDETQSTHFKSALKYIDLEMVFRRCDLDNDGYIDWHDFLITACNKHRAISKYNLDEAFYSFDQY